VGQRNVAEEEFIVADIKVTNEAGITKHFYEVDSAVAALLCHAGIAHPIAKALAQEAVPAWVLRHLQSGKWCIQLTRTNGETVWFTAAPEVYKAEGLQYADAICPAAVIEEYSRRWQPASIV
jgi:hypothetical protein